MSLPKPIHQRLNIDIAALDQLEPSERHQRIIDILERVYSNGFADGHLAGWEYGWNESQECHGRRGAAYMGADNHPQLPLR